METYMSEHIRKPQTILSAAKLSSNIYVLCGFGILSSLGQHFTCFRTFIESNARSGIMAAQKRLRIGVFIPGDAQLLDVSPVDLFGMLDPKYLTACQLPSSLVSLGTPSTIDYISASEAGGHIRLTANAFLRVSKSIDDPDVQPGSLHIVLVPGPNPTEIFDEKVRGFLKAHADWRGEDGRTTDILSVCTGCVLLGQAGILKGKRASGPRGLLSTLEKKFPDTTWVDDKRWVIDGNIWTSGESEIYIFDNLASFRPSDVSYRGYYKRAGNGCGIYKAELPWPDS
jgi:hypothetical protein